jgi:hypothetical protein
MRTTVYTLFFIVFLSACGSKSGGSASSSAPGSTPTPPTCKSIYSVWTSTTDHEQFDLTGLENQAIHPDYEYTAYDGATCGYATNPNHTLTAQLVLSTTGYTLYMSYSLAMGGQCATYLIPSSIGGKNHAAFITETACNEIEICGQTTCKLFR